MSRLYVSRVHLCVLMTLLIMVLSLLSLGGQTSPTDQAGNSIGNAEMEDLKFVADEEGITYEDTIEKFGWHDEFAQTIGDIRDTSPNAFTIAEITGDSTAMIAF